jgi:hypothetical protein
MPETALGTSERCRRTHGILRRAVAVDIGDHLLLKKAVAAVGGDPEDLRATVSKKPGSTALAYGPSRV